MTYYGQLSFNEVKPGQNFELIDQSSFSKDYEKEFTKNIDNNYYVFSSFLARIFTTIIHFLKRIRHYESRCQADDPLLLFHLIVSKAQLELVPWQSLS